MCDREGVLAFLVRMPGYGFNPASLSTNSFTLTIRLAVVKVVWYSMREYVTPENQKWSNNFASHICCYAYNNQFMYFFRLVYFWNYLDRKCSLWKLSNNVFWEMYYRHPQKTNAWTDAGAFVRQKSNKYTIIRRWKTTRKIESQNTKQEKPTTT